MPSLRERREAVVQEHMESENRHEFDVTLGTFGHPRYEIVATGEVHDGPEEVMRYFKETDGVWTPCGPEKPGVYISGKGWGSVTFPRI